MFIAPRRLIIYIVQLPTGLQLESDKSSGLEMESMLVIIIGSIKQTRLGYSYSKYRIWSIRLDLPYGAAPPRDDCTCVPGRDH